MAVGAPGQILSGKYRLERELGRGGMGSVWRAQHLTLRSACAIKLIEEEIAQNPEALSRFLREAQAAASLRSPHVVQILDHGVDEGVPFIVMELLDGESLAARLARVQRLSPPDTARLITQVGRAMTKAHEAGIVHRDLKPDNIFLVRNDEEELAKVLDFGVAKSRTHGIGSVSTATRTGSVLGTPYYMSPEQAEGSKSVDHRSDIWSMGVIAWECLLGARPFEAETLGGLLLAICARDIPVPSRVGHVPPGFDAWFARACSRDLRNRFDTVKEAAQELRNLCGTVEAVANPTPFGLSGGAAPAASMRFASTTGQLSVSAPSQAPTKSKAPWIAAGVVAVLVTGSGGAFLLRGVLGGAVPAPSSSVAVVDAPPSDPKAGATAVTEAPKPAAPPPAEPPAAPVASASAPPAAPAPAAVPRAAARPASKNHVVAAAPAKPAAATAAAPAPTPPPAPAPTPTPAPAAAARPRVNLGI
jgi:hypothetical protein